MVMVSRLASFISCPFRYAPGRQEPEAVRGSTGVTRRHRPAPDRPAPATRCRAAQGASRCRRLSSGQRAHRNSPAPGPPLEQRGSGWPPGVSGVWQLDWRPAAIVVANSGSGTRRPACRSRSTAVLPPICRVEAAARPVVGVRSGATAVPGLSRLRTRPGDDMITCMSRADREEDSPPLTMLIQCRPRPSFVRTMALWSSQRRSVG